jgi:hypothetical protein
MYRSFRTLIIFFGLAAALVCHAVFVYYPALPRSVAGWLGMLFVGVPLLFLIEWLGEKTLGSAFFDRLSSVTRIALGVPVFVLLMVVVVWFVTNTTALINR